MEDTAILILDGKKYEFPVITGSEGEKAIDIKQLRALTGHITYDPGFGNTGSCQSAITYMDGEKGVLRYRGIPVEELAEHSSFVETAFLLITGNLPNQKQLTQTSIMLNDYSLVHEDMRAFYEKFPSRAHPMGIMSAMFNALRSFYPELDEEDVNIDTTFLRIISKIRTMAALAFRISRGHKVVYPRPDYCYCANFLNMMFDNPVKPYTMDRDLLKALNAFWILHADHEQNCSTSAVRLVGSGKVNVYASLSAGISALWGPLHGGANQAVVKMLENIAKKEISIDQIVTRSADRNDDCKLMGFGHRVYKTYDPRAKIMKKLCDKLLDKMNLTDPIFDIARELEYKALNDPYFIDHNLYPNVDFYSGIVLKAMGIPVNMFTVMFAIGRLPGWIAQWQESSQDPEFRIGRPRQVYSGDKLRHYVPMSERD